MSEKTTNEKPPLASDLNDEANESSSSSIDPYASYDPENDYSHSTSSSNKVTSNSDPKEESKKHDLAEIIEQEKSEINVKKLKADMIDQHSSNDDEITSEDSESPDQKDKYKKNSKHKPIKKNRKDRKNDKRTEENKQLRVKGESKNQTEIALPIFIQKTNNESVREAGEQSRIKVKFHVYVPPEFDVDTKSCSFGIQYSINTDWSNKTFLKMNLSPCAQGYILTGLREFTKKEYDSSNFEYKYVLNVENNSGEVANYYEYFGSYGSNRTLDFKKLNPNIVNMVYDGLMLPPDKDNEGNWAKIKKFFSKKIFRSFYSDDILIKYLDETIEVMLFEISKLEKDDPRINNFKNAMDYLKATFSGILQCYKKIDFETKLKKFIIKFVKLLDSNKKLTIAVSIAILTFLASQSVYFGVCSEIISDLLRVFYFDSNVSVESIFENSTDQNIINILNGFFQRHLIERPESIYLLEFIIKSKINQNSIDHTFYMNNKYFELIKPFMEKLPLYNPDYTKKVFTYLRTNATTILKSIIFPVFLMNSLILIDDLTSVFTMTDILGHFLFLSHQAKNTWSRTDYYRKISSFDDIQNRSINILAHSIDQFLEKSTSSDNNELIVIAKCCCPLLLDFSLKNVFTVNYTTIFLLITKLYTSNGICFLDAENPDNIPVILDAIFERLRKHDSFQDDFFLKNHYSIKLVRNILRNWSLMHQIIEVSNEKISEKIRDFYEKFCLISLRNIHVESLIKLCKLIMDKEIDAHSNVEKEIFEAIKFNLDKMDQKDINSFVVMNSDFNNELVSDLVNEILKTKWPAKENEFAIFNFIFECNNFLKVFVLMDSNVIGNNRIFQEKILQIISLLDSTIIDLMQGSLPVYQLISFKENQKILSELYELFEPRLSKKPWNDRSQTKDFIEKLVEIRMAEVKCFENFISQMKDLEKYLKIFDSTTRELNVDFKDFEHKLKDFTNIKNLLINSFIECFFEKDIILSSGEDFEKIVLKRIYHFDEINKDNLSQIKKFISKSHQCLYLRYFTRKIIQKMKSPVNLKTFLDLVICQADLDFENFGESVKNGTLDLEYFSEELIRVNESLRIGRDHFKNFKIELEKVMKIANMSEKEIEYRFKQIKHYLNLPKIKEISTLLLEIKEHEELTGNFEPLEQISHSLEENVNQVKTLKDITAGSMKLYETLDKLSEVKFVKCLSKYVENFSFIEWLRKNVPNLNSLKLLCEFASESENEGALEVVRVQSLSLVGTAFSPLVYDLKKIASFDQLIEHIKAVFQTFLKNQDLAEKMDAIAKERAWLEDIKDSKGNTEANSLKQAKRINEFGIFDFGLTTNVKKENITLEDVIKVTVPASNNEPKRFYTFTQLRDLQDKLTLVVGKDGEQQKIIGYFEDVFESLILLGDIYISLMHSGNVLFTNWNAIIYNDEKEANTMKINFGIQNHSQNIYASRKNEKTTINSINKAIKFLKKCLEEWLTHVNEKRDQFPNLNHFKISQLVDLRIRLAEFISSQTKFEDHQQFKDLFDLIYNINPNIDVDLLQKANEIALNKNLEIKQNEEENKQLETKPDHADLIDELIELGFDKKLIIQGIKELKEIDKETLTEYCFTHELSAEQVTNPKQQALKVIENSEQIILNIMSDFNGNEDPYDDEEKVDDLEDKFNKIWIRFLEYLDLNFEDYVSLNHLGLVLDYLKQNSTILINRIKPPYLEYNTPNLIICPQDEIINRTLSIYSLSPEQPLPTNEEVLYCNSKTTSEEIELFWKRVMTQESNNDSQKIYCLINVQDLLYDQAVKAQVFYERLISNRDSNSTSRFLVCIICSSEKEDKSVFVTAFNRYRRNVRLEHNSNSNLNKYLKKQFEQKNTPKSLRKIEKDGLNVRVVTSDRAGVGKSLYIQRLIENSKSTIDPKIEYCCISIKKQTLPFEQIFQQFKNFEKKLIKSKNSLPKIFHIDIAFEVWYEVDYFLFNLLCLGSIENLNGKIYRRSSQDLYLIEIMSPKFKNKDDLNEQNLKPLHSILNILPMLNCVNPVQTLSFIKKNNIPENTCPILFDEKILRSDIIQRPCQYLQALSLNQNLDTVRYDQTRILSVIECLELLLKHLENENPSWSEIKHFACFLNTQLIDCENSYYCDPALTSDILPGFKAFVVKFMIQMAHDFALPSLEISDRSALQIRTNYQAEFQLDQLKMRRKWENDPHPYLFFNPDGQTFTFFGFYVDPTRGTLLDSNSNRVLFEDSIRLHQNLIYGINLQNRQILRENVAQLSKLEKIQKLMSVMGIEWATHGLARIRDPDPSYELTMDNLLKILAIYMRLRADIPVIIMGETGCGKTRLCKYMCELQKNPDDINTVENMYLVKVHGGTSAEEIINHVEKAQDLARRNLQKYPGMFTVLFFDEANSTEAIGTIKEIMCDSRINGKPLDKTCSLKIIAACNPYKKHSEDIIKNFEKSGLGFYVDMNETQEKLGDLPMRHLVYRVQPLPASMLPIIWDFGQLNDQVEKLYINQIVSEKFGRKFNHNEINLIVEVLSVSQKFMREQKNECSFVSLRDIQRVLKIIDWFMTKGQIIFAQLKRQNEQSVASRRTSLRIVDSDDDLHDENEDSQDEQDEEEDEIRQDTIENNNENLISSLILALNACYHVGLQSEDSRRDYRRQISTCFPNNINDDFILNEIDKCYEIFLDEIHLPDAIARNQALKENIFMMLICIELKIPLFIIGKPGSSKSLSKTLISQKMQGSDRNNSTILKNFKEAHLITFQCSPLSTSEMILNTFRYCAKYQLERRNDLDRYTSVIVLDEIGLAEASTSMPLKTLHPLLEDGVHFEDNDEKEFMKKINENNRLNESKEDWHRIGFIGISNWVLDPAKMNRGIFVNRNSPSTTELKETVIGICKNDDKVLDKLQNKNLIESLSEAYLKLCEKARSKTREFFGLRDFYSLIKMIYWH
ncbi:unnamed protein product, partial [Brachionus calyciflorus]